MKKFLLILCIPMFLLSSMYAVDHETEINISDQQELTIDDGADAFDAPVYKKNKFKKKKESKIKKFFKKLNPFKKGQEGFHNFVIAFILGFLLGIIGILIAFLVYLRHDNRKQIMRFAWLGWLWWLVILSIVFLAI